MTTLLPEVFVLSNESALRADDPPPSCKLALTELRWAPASVLGDPSASRLTIKGLAWGLTQVSLRLLVKERELIHSAEVQTNGWSTNFDLSDAGVTPGTVVRLEATSPPDQSCQASDQAAITLGVSDAPQVPPGCPSRFDAQRVGLLAGQPSRVIEMRLFSTLADSGMLAKVKKLNYTLINIYTPDPGKPIQSVPGAGRFGTSVAFSMGQPAGYRLSHRVDLEQYVRKLEEGVRGSGKASKRSRKASGKAEARPANRLHQKRQALAESMTEAPAGTSPSAMTPAIVVTTPVGASGFVTDQILYILEVLLSAISKLDGVGVLFYDEVHFRPIGLVPGESIYQLSLAPGEEVVLTEEHSSKLSSTLEDMRDRESERNLEFDSSWTTDVTQTLANELQAKIGGNLGGGVTIPKTPINVEAGIDPELAAKNSREFVVKLVNEVSRKMTTKMREQHKTTLTVTTEETRGTGTQRTVWNPNPSRVLDLTYYKLYRKERVTLERHDAKLCLAVYVEDPAKQARDILLEGIERMRPTNAELHNCVAPPAQETKTEEKNHVDFGVWDPFSRLVGFQFQGSSITLTPTNSASDMVLASASLKVVKWVISHFSGEDEELSGASFENSGGDVYFGGPIAPKRLDSPGTPGYEIHVEAPLSMFPFAWVTKQVVVEVTSTWMAEPSAASDYTACMQAEQARLSDNFSVEALNALADRVRSLSRKLVFGELIDSYLLAIDPLQAQASPDAMDLVSSLFEWNEAVVEYLPWWLTPHSRAKYDEVRAELRALPGDFSIDDIVTDELVSARARVYLPIQPGSELEALGLIGHDGESIEAIVGLFTQFRNDNFNVIDRPLPNYEDITSPQPMHGTPLGETDWNEHWERPPRKFQVLADWSELLPSNAIHCEPSLSTCTATDEVRTADLRRRRTELDLKK